MKGVHPHEEIADLPAGWQVREVTPLSVPGLAGEIIRRNNERNKAGKAVEIV